MDVSVAAVYHRCTGLLFVSSDWRILNIMNIYTFFKIRNLNFDLRLKFLYDFIEFFKINFFVFSISENWPPESFPGGNKKIIF